MEIGFTNVDCASEVGMNRAEKILPIRLKGRNLQYNY